MNARGSVFKYPDNVDTDVIIPARHLNTQDAKELASHCMEDIDKDFVNRVQPGDIMVGGWNFGCGSSREHAPLCIKTAGIAVVIAKSFARIFYRNSINIGLPHVPLDAGDRAPGIRGDLALCRAAHQTLAILGKGHHAGGGALAFGVGDDHRLAALHHRHTGVGGAKVDSDHFAHSACPLFFGAEYFLEYLTGFL